MVFSSWTENLTISQMMLAMFSASVSGLSRKGHFESKACAREVLALLTEILMEHLFI